MTRIVTCLGLGCLGGIILTGCNREILPDLNQKFTSAYVDFGAPIGTQKVTIKSWRDYENSDTVQISTTDGRVILTHYAKIVLVKGDL